MNIQGVDPGDQPPVICHRKTFCEPLCGNFEYSCHSMIYNLWRLSTIVVCWIQVRCTVVYIVSVEQMLIYSSQCNDKGLTKGLPPLPLPGRPFYFSLRLIPRDTNHEKRRWSYGKTDRHGPLFHGHGHTSGQCLQWGGFADVDWEKELCEANLTGADLSSANLKEATLKLANLDETD